MTTEWCGVPSPWEIDAPYEVYDDAVAHAAAREAEREADPELEAAELEAAETDAELTGPRADVFDRAYARFEPSPYGLGITDDPEPVPYALTPAAEAALDNAPDPGPYPGSGDPERLAQWCGFPSAAAMEAACEAYGRELAGESEAEGRWEAECEALAAEAEGPEAVL